LRLWVLNALPLLRYRGPKGGPWVAIVDSQLQVATTIKVKKRNVACHSGRRNTRTDTASKAAI